MRTLHDIIAVEKIEPDQKSKGGIWLPDCVTSNIEKGVYFGIVKAVGDEVKDLKAGDKIMFLRWENELWDDDDHKNYCGLHEHDVIALIDDEEFTKHPDPYKN